MTKIEGTNLYVDLEQLAGAKAREQRQQHEHFVTKTYCDKLNETNELVDYCDGANKMSVGK